MDSLKHPASIRLYFYIFIISCVTYFLALLFGYLIYPPVVDQSSTTLLYVIEAIVTIALLRRYFINSDLSFTNLLQRSESKFSWLKLLGLFLCTFLLGNVSTLLFRIGVSQIWPDQITSLIRNLPVDDSMNSGVYYLTVLFYLIYTSFMVPIWEEVLFRGLILNQWMEKHGAWKGIVLSSLFFGILHLDHFIGATLIGLMFACVAVQTKTLRYTMILHLLFNNIASIEEYQFLFTLKRVAPITENPYLQFANLPTLSLIAAILIASAIPYTLYLLVSKRNLAELSSAGFLTYETPLEDSASFTESESL